MPITMRLFMSCLLFCVLFQIAATATVAHTLDSTFANSNHLILDAYILKLVFPLLSAIGNTLEFLRRNHLPPWLRFIAILAALSQPFRQLLGDSFLAFLKFLSLVLDRWLDQSKTIRELQRLLNAQCDPAQMQHLSDTIYLLKQQLEA